MPSKYIQLADVLRCAVLEGVYRREERLPTEQELCHRYRVSRQTVRHALAVLVEEGLIERQQGSGSRVRKSALAADRCKIAVLTPEGVQTAAELQDVQSVLSRYGYEMQCFATQNRQSIEQEVLRQVLDLEPAGVLVEGVCSALPSANLDLYHSLERDGVPVVFLRSGYAQLEHCVCVSDDNIGGGYQLTAYLLGTGHRRIAAMLRSDDRVGLERYQGYACALRDREVPLPDDAVVWYTQSDLMDMRRFDEGLFQVVSQRLSGCTAVLCYDDEVAELILQALEQGRIAIPEELTVVGFDDGNHPLPVPFTRLTRPAAQLGAQAAEQLCSLLQGKQAESVQLTWELVKKRR